MKEQLTVNFRLGEFLTSLGAKAYYLSLPPGKQQEVYLNIFALANRLQVLRDILGCPIKIISGLRTPERNAAVGGSSESTHLDGSGCDFDIPAQFRPRLQTLIDTEWSGGYKYYPNDSHFHVDIRPVKARW